MRLSELIDKLELARSIYGDKKVELATVHSGIYEKIEAVSYSKRVDSIVIGEEDEHVIVM
jgi:hypothetical protein